MAISDRDSVERVIVLAGSARALHWIAGVTTASVPLILALTLMGIGPWGTVQSPELATFQPPSLYLIALYTALILLYVHNMFLLFTARDALYRHYSFYIAFLILHLLFYERLLGNFGIHPPPLWEVVAGVVFANLSTVYIFQFARVLLVNKPEDKAFDTVMVVGIWLSILICGLAFAVQYWVTYLDPVLTLGFGAVLLVKSVRDGLTRSPAALMFAFSWLANMISYAYSWVAMIQPDAASHPAFAWVATLGDPESVIWVTGLTLEALLMSLVIGMRQREVHQETQDAHAEALASAENAVRSKDALHRMTATASALKPDGNGDDAFLSGLKDAVLARMDDLSFDVAALAKAAATSPATLRRRVKAQVGLTPAEFLRQVRLDHARGLLESQQVRTVAEAAQQSGFSNLSHFSKIYQDSFGQQPQAVLKTGQ